MHGIKVELNMDELWGYLKHLNVNGVFIAEHIICAFGTNEKR
jgi:hypothetical protein